ncbi:MAG TPA: hypothetical protein VMG82_13235, partial [Candidatus Sulfotelmatobacter sp.]|nr:hypothetical protein [Candidatus Sulfotelmatobacter sp.]
LGPDEPVALTGHRKVATDVRAALATRLAALSGSHIKASGSAGGYLLVAICERFLRFEWTVAVIRMMQISVQDSAYVRG